VQATFERAMQSRQARIAGVRLGPLTLAQAYCLYAWESPVVRGGQIGMADFALALWTCSQPCWPFSRFVVAVNAEKPQRILARIGRRYDLRRFAVDSAALREWIDWHCKTPPRFLKPTPDSKGAAAPWPMVVAVQLIPMLGEDRVWQMPVPLAMAYKIAVDNAQGDTSWKSESESEQGYANGGDSQSNS
jgi:hypothetical protein